MLALAVLLVSLLAAAVYGLAVVATVLHAARSARPVPAPDAPPGVSLLKPLKGLEEGLEDNLTSLYTQDYAGPVEVVIATTDRADPALAVARRVAAAHPAVPTRFVQSDPGFGLNPKVANLQGAVEAARYDLVLQTDANVALRPGYLTRVVSELLAEGAHLLTSLVVGSGEQSLGAALHNVHLCAFTAPGTCFAHVYAGIVVVIGKSMLFRRSDLDEVGGLAVVRDILAEDFVLGRAFRQAGKRVMLSSTRIENRNVRAPVGHFLERQARWLKMRAVVHVPGFVVDLLSNPVGLAFVAFLLSGLAAPYGAVLAGLAVLKGLSDALVVRLTRGVALSWRHAYVPALRDLAMLLLWPYCAVSRTVRWRGTRRVLGAGSRLHPAPGTAAATGSPRESPRPGPPWRSPSSPPPAWGADGWSARRPAPRRSSR